MMKRYFPFKALLMSFFYYLFPLLTQAQIGDTVTLYVDNRVELKIAIIDYDYLKKEPDSIAQQLTIFQKHLSAIGDQLKTEEAELIYYTPDSAITVRTIEPHNTFLIQKDKVLNTGFRDKAILKMKHMVIQVTAADLSKVQDVSLSNCYLKMIQALPPKVKAASELYFQCKDGNVSYLEHKTVKKNLDAIELSLGTGASLLRNRWVGDLSFQLGLQLNKKGRIQHAPYISANLMYDFPNADKVNINTFLNLGYEWKIGDREVEISRMGAEFGYLISRQGEAFKEGTFRFGLNWRPLDAVSFNPQIYFPGGIKNAYPGVRIGFGF